MSTSIHVILKFHPLNYGLPYCAMDPQERDSIGIGFPTLDVLGKLHSAHQGSIFVPVKLVKPDMEPLLGDIPEDTKLWILKAMQEAHDKNSTWVQAWESQLESTFMACYSASVELINGMSEKLRANGKFLGALDIH